MEKKRIAFTFDNQSFETLEETQRLGHYATYAQAVRDSLGTYNALQEEVSRGFTEIVVRNPESGKEKVLVSHGLKRAR